MRSGKHVPRTVRRSCPGCGGARFISHRHNLSIDKGEHSPLCPLCRHPATFTVKPEHRNYWLQRFSMTEIREMAAGLELLLNDHSRGARQRRMENA
jgi:hypothetical protein